MAFKQFLQNLFERVGLVEPPAAPPQAVNLLAGDPQQTRPIVARLANWGVKDLHLIAGEEPEAGDLVQVARQAVQLGMRVKIRGRASDLAHGTLLADLAAARVHEIEILFLSAIGEVHDGLAGAGDYRCALRTMDALASFKLPFSVQIIVVPSTRKTIEQTLQLLHDRQVHDVRFFAIACRDDEPSSWAISASELVVAAQSIEKSKSRDFDFSWYPPLTFDPARTLAEQVRRGPRASWNAVCIEPDGRLIPPTGPAVSAGNVLRDDWKSIARSEVFRTLKRRRAAAARCAGCPGLAVCEGGCLRDAGNWSEY